MKKWFLDTSARLAAILGVLVVGMWFAVWLPEQQARQMVGQQLDQTRSEIEAINKADAVLSSGNTDANSLHVAVVAPKKVSGVGSRLVRAVNEVVDLARERQVRSVPADLAEVQELTTYHVAVSKALENLTSYNPADDTAGFQLGSADSTGRVARARAGLKKTATQLDSARKLYTDPSLSQVSDALSQLQDECSQLGRTGDTDAWIKDVHAAQDTAAGNRTKFWAAKSPAIKASLQQDLEQTRSVQSLWSQLAQGYKI